jgi:hypothetical protein
MLGMTESEIIHEIDHGCFGIAPLTINIKDQLNLEPDDILKKLAKGVAQAIEKNNRKITNQLRALNLQI